MALDAVERDLVTTAQEALDSLSALVSARTVSREGDEGGVTVAHDPQLMTRVIANLVSNALRYTPAAGSITVKVTALDGRARVEVRDEGPGIPEEYREKIFEKFGQIEAKQEGEKLASTGLGLTFCKLAVEAHGGAIGVDSVVGEGSTFWFEIPYTR